MFIDHVSLQLEWMTARGGDYMRNGTMRKYISFFETASIWCMPILTVVWLYVAFYILGFVIYLYIEILSMDVFYILCWKWKIKDVQSINHRLAAGIAYFSFDLCFYLHEVSQTFFVLFAMYQVTLHQIWNRFWLNRVNIYQRKSFVKKTWNRTWMFSQGLILMA